MRHKIPSQLIISQTAVHLPLLHIHTYVHIYIYTHTFYVCTYVYMYLYPFCLNVLPECMYVHRVCLHCSWRSERISGSLELEFQMVVDPYVGAGKRT